MTPSSKCSDFVYSENKKELRHIQRHTLSKNLQMNLLVREVISMEAFHTHRLQSLGWQDWTDTKLYSRGLHTVLRGGGGLSFVSP